jgi:hypothetical protein
MKRVLIILALFFMIGVVSSADVCTEDSDCVSVNECGGVRCSDDGTCLSYSLDVSCDDGDPCTLDDVCSNFSCSGVSRDIDDGNILTDDLCLANGSIIHREFIVSDSDEIQSGSEDSVDDSDSGSGETDSDEIDSSDDTESGSNDTDLGDSGSGDGSLWWLWVLIVLAVVGIGSWLGLKYFKSKGKKIVFGSRGIRFQNIAAPQVKAPVQRPMVPPRRMPPRRDIGR